jgi:hypothetical protein
MPFIPPIRRFSQTVGDALRQTAACPLTRRLGVSIDGHFLVPHWIRPWRRRLWGHQPNVKGRPSYFI